MRAPRESACRSGFSPFFQVGSSPLGGASAPSFFGGWQLDKSHLNNASMAEVIEQLQCRELTTDELRAALMNAMRHIEELENQVLMLDDSLLDLYRKTGHASFARPLREKPGSVPTLTLVRRHAEDDPPR
jgi:hypothetical protein